MPSPIREYFLLIIVKKSFTHLVCIPIFCAVILAPKNVIIYYTYIAIFLYMVVEIIDKPNNFLSTQMLSHLVFWTPPLATCLNVCFLVLVFNKLVSISVILMGILISSQIANIAVTFFFLYSTLHLLN